MKGIISSDDVGRLWSFAESDEGQVTELFSETIDFQRFDTELKAKEAACFSLRQRTADELQKLSHDFRHGHKNITVDLT